MDAEKLERFRKFHIIPEHGATASVREYGQSYQATIRTAHGETFKAGSTNSAYFALEAAMKKWRVSEDRRLKQLRGF